MRMAASWSRASQPHRIQGCRRDLLRARGTAPLGSIGHHRRGGRLGMLRVKARAYARPLRGFGLDPSAFPVFVACHHVGGDRRRSAQKSELPARLDKKRPIQGTSVCQQSEPPSRRGAIDRSGVGGSGAAFVLSRARISAPSAAPFHRKPPGLARPVAPQRRGS